MSRSRWLISGFLVCHLSALAIANIPPINRLPEVAVVRRPVNNKLAATLAPRLDAATARFVPFSAFLAESVSPLRNVSTSYAKVAGLTQKWSMFWQPPRADHYMRLRYYVGSSERTSKAERVATELVFPAHREDRVRIIRSFRDSYFDKAVSIAIGDFYGNLNQRREAANSIDVELPDDLAPFVRYFSRRFAHDHITPGERVLRTEVWLGRAANPFPGAQPDVQLLEARANALSRYYEGPIEQRLAGPAYSPYRAAEREADIEWLLEYFE